MKSLIIIFVLLIIMGCVKTDPSQELNSYKDLQEFKTYLVDDKFKSMKEEDEPTIIVRPQACQTEIDFVMFIPKRWAGKCYDIKSDAELTFGDYKDYLPNKDAEILLYSVLPGVERYYKTASYIELTQFLDSATKVISVPNEFDFYGTGLKKVSKQLNIVEFKTIIEEKNLLREYCFYKLNDDGFYLQIIDNYELENWETEVSSDYLLPDAKYLGDREIVSFAYFQTNQFYDDSYSFYLKE